MDFTTKSKAIPKASPSDLLTEILFSFSPQFMYQWVEDYSKTGRSNQLETIPHLTQYWDGVFQRAGVPEGVGLLHPTMSEEQWLATFTEQALPILRNNRKLLNYANHH